MLVSLSVQNFAIISNINIDFKDHMTVLTGETGAGKSLIIDAIGLLFGKRADSSMVRHGELKAVIEGCFSDYHETLKTMLTELDIPYSLDDFLIIKREIYSNGKSLCKVNNTTITLSNLVEIAKCLGDIHAQFDTYGLINPNNYLKFLEDDFIKSELLKYQIKLKNYHEVLRKYHSFINKAKESNMQVEFWKHQFQEIMQAKITLTEEEELKDKINELSNYEDIVTGLQEVIQLLDEEGTMNHIYHSVQTLQKLSKFQSFYQSAKEKVEESYYNLTDILSDLQSNFKKMDFDPIELERLNERLSIYSILKRKYKMTTEELIVHQGSLKNQLDMIENHDEYLKELENSTKKLFDETFIIAKNISNQRKQIANEFVKKITETLKELYLDNTIFEIFFDEHDIEFKNDGIDKIDFMISFNKGEPLKSLSKVASGGEMSRFMLSLKTLLSKKMNIQTIIFDEIDTGVSGSIAYSIANKIKRISEDTQVLCVTHLPQVASIANHHIKILKEIDEKYRTSTSFEYLNKDSRIIEIAKMISNGEVTDASKNMAIELLK